MNILSFFSSFFFFFFVNMVFNIRIICYALNMGDKSFPTKRGRNHTVSCSVGHYTSQVSQCKTHEALCKRITKTNPVMNILSFFFFFFFVHVVFNIRIWSYTSNMKDKSFLTKRGRNHTVSCSVGHYLHVLFALHLSSINQQHHFSAVHMSSVKLCLEHVQ